ncbi:LysR substrate-binding domain-containing protein [Ramlibacter sp.]|uniref:LysR substrate-binding domain-containing protein n=1 Tax=Ramlibacter sp. TaxID=1917967 RepID=UPI003D14A60F
MHFDLIDLRLMVNIAMTSSMTKGADLSNISLPAASVRVRSLEEAVGSKLLYRTSHGVTLTPAGQALVHHGKIVQGQVDLLKGDLQEYARGAKGHLRVAANTTALGEFLPAVLRTYLQTHRDVNIDLRERSSFDIVKSVEDGHMDIGIVAGEVSTGSLQALPYRTDRLVLVVPQDHELAATEVIEFKQSLPYDQVGLHEGTVFHAFLRGICDQLHMQWRLRIQVSNFDTACRMTEAGVGISVVPGAAARRHARSLSVSLLRLSDAWAIRVMQICVRDLQALPAFARDFVELLAEDADTAEE